MNDNLLNKNNDKNIKNTATAGAVGILIGAIGTAAIVLADAQMRKRATQKAGEMSKNLGKWGNDTMKSLQKTTGHMNGSKNKPAGTEVKHKEAAEETKEKTTRTVH